MCSSGSRGNPLPTHNAVVNSRFIALSGKPTYDYIDKPSESNSRETGERLNCAKGSDTKKREDTRI